MERTKATTIDILSIIVIMYVSSLLFESIGNVSADVRKWLFLSLFVFYEPVCTTFGTTLGNYIVKIRVRKVSNNEKNINIIRSFLRYFFKMIFGWFSFLTIFTSKQN